MKNAIALHAVVSTQIAAIGYDPASSTLAVQFQKKGLPSTIYNYASVPQDVYEKFAAAESKGKFLDNEIKKPMVPAPGGGNGLVSKYPHTKMDD